MTTTAKDLTIVMADDDPDDRFMVGSAFLETGFNHDLHFVADGEELLDFLYCRGKYAPPSKAPYPELILLDLNMPRKDGREALVEIKADPLLRHIPIIIFTTSQTREDILLAYNNNASSYITKPITFAALISIMNAINHYWSRIVKLPAPSLP